MKTTWIILLGALAAIIGCGQPQGSHGETKKESPKTNNGAQLSGFPAKWQSLPENAVVIKLGTNTVTRKQYEDYVSVMLTCMRVKMPSLTDDKVKVILKKRLTSVKNEVISRLITKEGLQATNRIDTTPYVKAVERQYERALSSKNRAVTFEQIRAAMREKDLEVAFMRNVEQDVQARAAMQTVFLDDIKVSDEEFKASRASVEKRNARARAKNAENLAEAQKVWQELKNGGDFAKLADARSQDKDKNKGGDLGECDVNSLKFANMDDDAFEQTTYWKTVSSLKDGEYSPVLETDVGWEIVKMLGHVKAADANASVASYHLARIYFRRVYEFPQQEDEEFMADLEAEKRELFLTNMRDRVMKSHTVEFPSGEDVFPGYRPRSALPVGPRRELVESESFK